MVDVPSRDEFNALASRVTKLEQGSPPNPQPPKPSPDGTTITDTNGVIVDAKSRTFKLVGTADNYQINMDGHVSGAGVIMLYASGGKCYQENKDNLWWYMGDTDWVSTTSPLPAPPNTDKFYDDFKTLSLWNSYAPDNSKVWQLSRWYGPDWNGWANGDGWMINPWNPATPIQGMYATNADGLLLDIRRTPANIAAACGNKKFITSQVNQLTFAQKGGWWEGRMKCPNIPGTNFAFWLMNHKSWPPEVDIVEAVNHGDWTLMSQTIWHLQGQGNNDNYSLFKEQGFDISAWHTYGFWWDDAGKRMKMVFDGKKTMDVAVPNGYDDPMFIILSTQCGGDWAGPIPDSAQLGPLSVDYVRVADHPPQALANVL